MIKELGVFRGKTRNKQKTSYTEERKNSEGWKMIVKGRLETTMTEEENHGEVASRGP